ncbi:MAG: hypothetical protein V2B20_13210 [Pseudomonadota bacterium]
MSDLRIALIAEGTTDEVIINSALKAILTRPFILTLLQPEPIRSDLGGGWGGVLKWCREFSSRGIATFEEDPTLELYDLFVVHLDADVADFSYAVHGKDIELAAQQESWGVLPCSLPCPPSVATVDNLKPVLHSWLGIAAIGDSTVLCIPSKSSEAWLAAAVFPDNKNLLNGLECAMNMEGRLAQLPKEQRIKKKVREYRVFASAIETRWSVVREKCTHANLFHRETDAIAQRLFLRGQD